VAAVYPEVKALHPLELARAVAAAVSVIEHWDDDRGIPDPLPAAIVQSAELPSFTAALVEIHKPSDDIDADSLRALLDKSSPGHRRLAFEELFVLGIADMVSVVIRQSLVQIETPNEMRGRVMAVNTILTGTSNQLGEFESGALASLIGAVPTVIFGGVSAIVAALVWMRLFPSLRDREKI
jgi:RecG-like helicase